MTTNPTEPLTRMERTVLLFLADKYDNSEIALALSLTKNTIKVHKYNLYKKLGWTHMTKYEVRENLELYVEYNPDIFADIFPEYKVEVELDADDQRESPLAGVQVHSVCQVPHGL